MNQDLVKRFDRITKDTKQKFSDFGEDILGKRIIFQRGTKQIVEGRILKLSNDPFFVVIQTFKSNKIYSVDLRRIKISLLSE